MGKVFMWLFLCQDALMFMGLFAAYLSVRMGQGHLWPSPNNPQTIEHYPLDINLTALTTFILICSSVTMVMAVQSMHFNNRKSGIKWLLFTMLGGSIFLGIQVYEYYHLIIGDGMGMAKSLFDATFFSLTGFHGLHVFSGVVYLGCVAVALKLGHKVRHDNMFVVNIVRLIGIALAVWLFFGPFKKWPPMPHVILSIVIPAAPYIVWRGIGWLRERQDMPEITEITGLYWHFVDLIWIILFTLVYLL
jgi:heme/copper-type cytochrome/quinol oxidase subunit 3